MGYGVARKDVRYGHSLCCYCMRCTEIGCNTEISGTEMGHPARLLLRECAVLTILLCYQAGPQQQQKRLRSGSFASKVVLNGGDHAQAPSRPCVELSGTATCLRVCYEMPGTEIPGTDISCGICVSAMPMPGTDSAPIAVCFRYAMPGTVIHLINLCTCCVVSGPDIPYYTTRALSKSWTQYQVRTPISLCSCYAMPGLSVKVRVVVDSDWVASPITLRTPYALSGTDVAYAGSTRYAILGTVIGYVVCISHIVLHTRCAMPGADIGPTPR
eukprot:1697505-Rhodomonas_salina.1